MLKQMGRISVFTGAVLLAEQLPAVTSVTYTYDDLNRLTAVTRSDGPGLSYSYDEVGNITARVGINPDSDGDGLTDIREINIHLTNPDLSDSDVDSLSDADEVNIHKTDPNAGDTDADGVGDGDEVAAGTDPLDATSLPVFADGDLNADGRVNVADVLLAQRIVTGQLVPTVEQIRHADVAPLASGVPSPDGVLDLGDVLVIQRKAIGAVNF